MMSNWQSLLLSPAVQSLSLSAKHYIYKTESLTILPREISKTSPQSLGSKPLGDVHSLQSHHIIGWKTNYHIIGWITNYNHTKSSKYQMSAF